MSQDSTQPLEMDESDQEEQSLPGNPALRSFIAVFNFPKDTTDSDPLVDSTSRKWAAFAKSENVAYACFQLERAGRLHLQAYFELSGQMRFNAIKAKLGPSTHLERSKAGRNKNRAYCSKSRTSVAGTFQEFGEAKRQGRRVDLEEIKELMDDGALSSAIAESHFPQWVQYNRSFEKYEENLKASVKRSWKTKTIVLWGPTGTGKSLRARSLTAGAPTAVIHLTKGAEWWDSYHGEAHVIIDDFDPNQLDAARFKNIFDRYEMSVPVKGSYRNWVPKLAIITTNVDPATWYLGIPVNGVATPDAACQRRIDEIHYMDKILDPGELEGYLPLDLSSLPDIDEINFD